MTNYFILKRISNQVEVYNFCKTYFFIVICNSLFVSNLIVILTPLFFFIMNEKHGITNPTQYSTFHYVFGSHIKTIIMGI